MNCLNKLRKKMPEGGIVPPRWHRRRHEPQRQVGRYTTTPLQWVASVLREFHYRVHLAVTAPTIEQEKVCELQRAHQDRERLAEEYSKGYMAGWHECFEACLQAVEEEITNADEVWRMGAALAGPATTKRDN
jgi:hypothetical protein